MLACAMLVTLAGCASGPRVVSPGRSIAEQVVNPTVGDVEHTQGPINLQADQDQAKPEPVEPEIEVGTGRFINREVARAPVRDGKVPEGQVVFNFEDLPIQAVVKNILGDLLHENYIIAPGVNGRVTYATSQPVSSEEAMPILETLLSWTGNTLIFENGRYTVLPLAKAIPGNLTPRLAPAQAARGYEVRIFPLDYISPTEMHKLLTPFAPKNAFISIDTARSLLVMAGTPDQLINYKRTIDTFDVDWLKGMSVGVYNLQTQEVAKMLPQLEGIFGAQGESPLAGMFRFVPVEATNSIIVITPQPEYLAKAQEWLARLDAGGAGEAGMQLYIYDVRNLKAVDLAGYLNEIFNGISFAPARDTGGDVAPGLTPTEVSGSSTGRPARPTPVAKRSSSTATSGDGPRITAVEENNQLLVMATPSQWSTIQAAAQRLDKVPLQVQVEARILEVSLTGKFKFGVQWYLEGLIGINGDSPNGTQPGNLQEWALGGTAPIAPSGSFFYSFVNSEMQVAINALESSGNTKTLSAPSLVVMNNQEASMNVGTQIPTVQTFYSPGLGNFGNNGNNGSVGGNGFNSGRVSFRDTGIKLTVTPRVNPGGLVYLDVNAEVSNPGATPGPTGNVPISQRMIQTQVAVQSGSTVLLGGLIKENEIESEQGVPWLSRIPLLGNLFGTTSHDRNRTELLILITPRVIGNAAEARQITREYQLRFQSLKPLLRKKLQQGSQAQSDTLNPQDGD